MSLIEFPSPDTCLVHLVRHGATPHNLLTPPRLQGNGIDESLAELGQRQATAAARRLAARPVRHVYASPMKRAMETAAIIAREHRLEVEPVNAFCEVHVGNWEGRTWAEIQEEDATAYELYRQDPLEHGYPGGETGRQLVDRVSGKLNDLMRRHIGQEVVVVAHSVVNRLYLGCLLGVTPDRSHYTPQSNCGISTVRHKQGTTKVLTLNATSHLM